MNRLTFPDANFELGRVQLFDVGLEVAVEQLYHHRLKHHRGSERQDAGMLSWSPLLAGWLAGLQFLLNQHFSLGAGRGRAPCSTVRVRNQYAHVC